MREHEPFALRMFGIFNVEGHDPDPILILGSRASAEKELERRRALTDEDDDHLDQYHQVFRCDVIGVWWNSYDTDPREQTPLSASEVIAEFGGDHE